LWALIISSKPAKLVDPSLLFLTTPIPLAVCVRLLAMAETVFIDEYLSSFDAKKQLKYNYYHPNAKRGDVDKQSSQLILQTWLNEKRLD
jgi:RNase H-fold protein (predicted Holliday junction resolvase)